MIKTLNYIIKKYNIDTTKPSPISISISRDDLAKLFAELKFKKGAEIGVERGIYSEVLCRSNPNLTLYCIDPWKAYKGYIEHTTQKTLDEIYEDALDRLKNYSCQIIRDFSENAYKKFDNGSLDFVYIDGNHDAAHVKQDIKLWIPKVKRGGIISGHNFARYKGRYGLYNQIKDTVTKYANALSINPWFALRSPGEHSSWMWVKTQTLVDINGVAIFIPTYKRSHKILSVYKNAKESSPKVTEVYFIVEKRDKDSIKVLKDNNLPYFINKRSRNYAGAINTAYFKTKEKYFFCGADDLDFKPGWLEKCLKKMVDPIKVVGTNDLHNRDVLHARHATHYLVSREYAKKRSGVFDKKNLVLPENYFHNLTDREFIEVAKLRNVFTPCMEAVVEHLHWAWGLSTKDETYKKQDGSFDSDAKLYQKRRSLLLKRIKTEQKI